MDDASSDLTRINQEIYKKSAELLERNKVLSLLHTIDEITLSSMLDLREVVRKVTSVTTAQAELRGVAIMLVNKTTKSLDTLAVSQSGEMDAAGINIYDIFRHISLPLSGQENILVQTAVGRRRFSTGQFEQVAAGLNPASAEVLAKFSDLVKQTLLYPLVSRDELRGLMILFLGQTESDISEFKKDFLEQLPNIIGIALDNALLFKETQEANEKLKQLDKLKDDFVSLASHELRTPMTVIRSYLYMAIQGKAGELNPKQKFYLDRAYSSTVRLINLVNEMLNISRIESGRMSMNIQKIDLLALVKEVCFELRVRAQELGLALSVAEAELPPVLADADKIKEVLLNFIGNSFKFTPRGGSITVNFETKGDSVYIQVKDTGIGISPAEQDKLFQKFSMIGSSYKVNKTGMQGTGLGLFICKSIIELHKGTVSMYSEGVNKGSTFTFNLKIYSEDTYTQFQKEFGNKQGLDVIHSAVT